MPEHREPLSDRRKNPRTWAIQSWERLIAVKAESEEEARLGRLFNILMVISTGIVTALSAVFLMMQPLGFLNPWVSWLAAAFPLAFIPLSLFCLIQSRRGQVRPMVVFYVWVNLLAIGVAIWLFDGVYSPGWVLYAWTIAIAGTLLTPAYALGLSGGVLGYFLILLLLSRFGLYTSPLSFEPGREFVDIALTLIMLASTVGLLTYLNMRSLREAITRLRESEAMYRSVFDNAADIIFTVNKDTNYISLNPAFGKITGWPVDEWVGKSFVPMVPAEEVPTTNRVLQKTLRGQAAERFEMRLLKKSGDYFIGEMTVAPLKQGNDMILLGICRDVTERKRAEEELRALQVQLREAAIHDSLTGLYNRRYLEETLKRELARVARERHPLSILMADIDHFKRLNDTYGHQAGDEVLRTLGALLRSHARASDIPCRYGGEEFVVVMPDMPFEAARERAELLRRAFAELSIAFGDAEVGSTVSIGVSTYPVHGGTVDVLISAADQALYQAKQTGRNKVCFACHRESVA